MIQKQSDSKENPAQFILTTFKPELVSIAKNFYAILFNGVTKVSSITPVNKGQALSIIEAEGQQEQEPPAQYPSAASVAMTPPTSP